LRLEGKLKLKLFNQTAEKVLILIDFGYPVPDPEPLKPQLLQPPSQG
jgi:hypothetical protein